MYVKKNIFIVSFILILIQFFASFDELDQSTNFKKGLKNKHYWQPPPPPGLAVWRISDIFFHTLYLSLCISYTVSKVWIFIFFTSVCLILKQIKITFFILDLQKRQSKYLHDVHQVLINFPCKRQRRWFSPVCPRYYCWICSSLWMDWALQSLGLCQRSNLNQFGWEERKGLVTLKPSL